MTNNTELKSFLGTGWSFPPLFEQKELFNQEILEVKMVSDKEDIKQSLILLLSTKPGERAMNPEYGCDLDSVVFDTINTVTKNRVIDLIRHAILYFETRIDLNEVVVDDGEALEGFLNIGLYYTVRGTNTRSNVVYPFYIAEGTNVTNM